jgi:conjugative relaxase-like TrwC/TraI family protein
MTASLKVVHGGSGYSYLTRQVASGDVTRGAGQSLADYYTAAGAPPGRWAGRGSAALGVSGVVSEAQMKALYGDGQHPEAEVIRAQQRDEWERSRAAELGHGPVTRAELERAEAGWAAGTKLGREWAPDAFEKRQERLDQQWRQPLESALVARAKRLGLDSVEDLTRQDRQSVRLEVGLRIFQSHDGLGKGRSPVDDGELKAFIGKISKPVPKPTAGYDVVFTPCKSASIIWGLGGEEARQQMAAIHTEAVRLTIERAEREVAFTRAGAGGVRQLDTTGLVVTTFDHFDSRDGDPNLHTHAVIANKVQGVDGKWRALDARVLHKAMVSLSEYYDATFERLASEAGYTFETRMRAGNKRAVREIAGVSEDLIATFSTRRKAIVEETAKREAQYRAQHGRGPDGAALHQIANEANRATRKHKGAQESLADKIERWQSKATDLYGPAAIGNRLADGCRSTRTAHSWPRPSIEDLGRQVVENVEQKRCRWQTAHLSAEAARIVGKLDDLAAAEVGPLVDQVTAAALQQSISTEPAITDGPTPKALQRADGESMYHVHGSTWHTSATMLAAENRLLDAAAMPVRPAVDVEIHDAITEQRGSGLDAGQAALARHFTASERLLAVGVGPAGSGKTAAMAEVAAILRATGHKVLPVAPSAVAAHSLGDEIGAPAETIDKVLQQVRDDGDDTVGLDAGDMLLVDEAGMASTHDLDALTALAQRRGAVIRLLGDPHQLSAVEAGGAFRLLVHRTEAAHLSNLWRFADKDEAAATLGLREGDPAALDFYDDARRLHDGTREQLVDQLYAAWKADVADGKTSLMIAGDNNTVRELSERAQADRLADGHLEHDSVALRDGAAAHVGDVVVTRQNNRRLVDAGAHTFVKNGDLWTVQAIGEDGSMTVKAAGGGAVIELPADYVAAEVELGYALTVHRAQGMTVDTAHALVDDMTKREGLYVAMSRGRLENHAYAITAADVDEHEARDEPRDVREVLAGILANDQAERSATETIADNLERSESLATLVPQYEDAIGVRASMRGDVDNVLAEALGRDRLEQLRNDSAWHTLANRVAHLPGDHSARVDTVREVGESRGLGDADSAAAVLAWRLEPYTVDQPTIAADDDLGQWLDERREQISRRYDELERRAVDEQPSWLTTAAGPLPAETDKQGTWRAAARQASAYRDRWSVSDQERALGYEPDHGRQLEQWRTAAEALERAKAVELDDPAPASRGRGISPWARTRPTPERDDERERRRREDDRRRRDGDRRRGFDRDV